MSGTLSANVKPMKIDAGPLGGLYVTGALTGIALWQSNTLPADEDARVDVTNGQVVVQKVDGPIQFLLEGGAYSFPTVGSAYTRAGTTTSETFGGLPVWFLKYAPNDAMSVQAGNLPTLIGAEYGFTFQNVNVQRGLIWNQENIINRGVQGNYTAGPLALSVAWSDGYFSNRYSWITGLATYTIDPADSIAFSAGGSVNTETVSSFVTPLLQNNSTIYNLVYTRTQGPWTFIPTLQYTNVPSDTKLGTTHSLHTFGAGFYGIYTMDGGYSVAGRAEYISSSGHAGDPSLLFGPGSNAWSLTVTPTWQNKFFFARVEASYVKATSTTPGFVFGSSGTSTTQARLLLETGVLF
ncbi:MAG TPA: outer membrane beta-barrel protein [Burkholderiaceae bacterium]|nr:outer membrane beta-barrel protein [Burkholderiaceae bacterium]